MDSNVLPRTSLLLAPHPHPRKLASRPRSHAGKELTLKRSRTSTYHGETEAAEHGRFPTEKPLEKEQKLKATAEQET